MIYLLIIEDQKVHIIDSEEHLADKYNYLPSEEYAPITFPTYEEALEWATANVKPELLHVEEPDLTADELRAKYLIG